MQKRPKHILPLIVLAQFAGTSLWFTGNAVLPELKRSLNLSEYSISYVTTAVMVGFIAGTLVFAFFSLADRFSPARLFFVSSLAGALFNVIIIKWASDATTLFLFRLLTGFFLAGIYPVGMKIAADWYEKGLGKAMGFLLGALILGTAFPYLLRNRDFQLPWKSVLIYTSLFATTGAFIILFFVGDGPYRKKSGRFQLNAFREIFSSKKWRHAAFGYFGHMWELYSFWGFLPALIGLYASGKNISLNTPLICFIVIGSGSLSSIAGGYLSQKWGSAKIASTALLVSGTCCFLSPLFFHFPPWAFLALLILWGLTVSPDSPQFSTLVAKFAPDHLRGTALTIYNSIGFTITVISLQVIDRIFHSHGLLGGQNTFLLLGFGALFALPSLIKLITHSSHHS